MKNCYVCRSEYNLTDSWSVYATATKPKIDFAVCTDCSEGLGELKRSVIINYNKSNCCFCERELRMVTWDDDRINGIYLDILRKKHYYRVCKDCWDSEIDLPLEIESVP